MAMAVEAMGQLPRIDGLEVPFFPAMAATMDPAPDALRRLAGEFQPEAEKIDPTAYWIGLHFWVAERLSAAAVRDGFPTDSVTLRQARWLMYATCYLAGLEQRKYASLPAPDGMFAPPTAESTAGLATELKAIDDALAGLPDARFDLIAARLRAAPGVVAGDTMIVGSMLVNTAYNTFYLITIGEAPPLGDRNPSLQQYCEGNVVADPAKLLQIGYAEPVPDWLAAARKTYEEAAAQHPDELERVLVGAEPDDVAGGPNDLRTLWASAADIARSVWGSDATAGWTQAYYDVNMAGTVKWNWGLEAISFMALTALVQHDATLAGRALVGASLFDSAWGAFWYGGSAAPADEITLPIVTLA
jgi:hypothetical protein